ncbi:MAG: helix-turn-helix domain-containing protein [Desulfobacterales bacterium]|nr:helix-turn-helix domain-containing protein [Desulfobacterales bacterium]
MKNLLLVKEAATILRCSTKTIYRLINENQLEALKVRGSLRIIEGSIQSYLNRQYYEFKEQNGYGKKFGTSLDGLAI